MPSITSLSAIDRHTTRYLHWWQVVEIAEEAGIPRTMARKIIGAAQDTEDEPRKYLRGRSKPLYVRCVVLRLFGLLEESAPA
jgi:hypothetical protein